MKLFFSLAAITGLFSMGCASNHEASGGTFDNSFDQPEYHQSPSGGHYDPATRGPEYHPATPGPSPSELIPQDEEESSPDFVVPRNRAGFYNI